jgi:hypothetical protein
VSIGQSPWLDLDYNFVRIHKTLRVTPAMAAGVSDRLWEVSDIVALLEAAEPKPGKRGPYKKESHMTKQDDDAEFVNLEWLVKSRSENQKISLVLFKLLKDHRAEIRKDRALGDISQGLVAVVFSLWRAVFLSNKTVGASTMLDHAERF